MDGTAACSMQNLIGHFLWNYNLSRPELSEELFAANETVWMRLPDRGIAAAGAAAIRDALRSISAQRNADAPLHRDLHITGSPAYRVAEDGASAQGKWDTYAFEVIRGEDGTSKVEYYFTRVDAGFVTENGQWKIQSLDWYEIYSFVPWDYEEEGDEGLLLGWDSLPLPPEHLREIGPADFYGIQNVLTRYVYNGRKYAMEDTFAHRPDTSFQMIPFTEQVVTGSEAVAEEIRRLRDLEKQNNGRYLLLHPVSTPVIELSADGQTATGQWMSYMFTVLADAFGCPGTDNKVIRRVGMVRCDFVKEDGNWRILHFDLKTLLKCPDQDFSTWTEEGRPTKGKTFMRVGLTENQWVYARPRLGGNFPDELPVVESLMPGWVNAYRRGELGKYIKEHMINEETDACFHSRMMGRNAAPVVGSAAVYDKFSTGNFLYHHQQPAFHGGINPDVQIDADGRYATVSYIDVSHTPFVPALNQDFGSNGRNGFVAPEHFDMDNCGLEHVPCVHRVANYCFSFNKVDGEWKHSAVMFDALLTLPNLLTRGKESRGWAGCITDIKYPDLWEPYIYRSERKVKKIDAKGKEV